MSKAIKRVPGKMSHSRVFADFWMAEMSAPANGIGGWSYQNMLDMGHRITLVMLGRPSLTTTEAPKNKLKIGNNSVRRTVHTSRVDKVHLATIKVNSRVDFDEIYSVMNTEYPELVNQKKPLIVSKLVTVTNEGRVCVWKKTNVGCKGSPALKMVCVSIDKVDTKTVSIPLQKKIVGNAIIEGICTFQHALEEMEACHLTL